MGEIIILLFNTSYVAITAIMNIAAESHINIDALPESFFEKIKGNKRPKANPKDEKMVINRQRNMVL
jgi:translation initiation factor 2 gamma subunit (eIF-2gamma)